MKTEIISATDLLAMNWHSVYLTEKKSNKFQNEADILSSTDLYA